MPRTALSRLSLAVAAITVTGIASAWAVTGGGLFSPGGLRAADTASVSLSGVASHAALARRCDACHAPPWSGSTMAARCLACHTDIQRELPDSTALHGGLGEVRDCLACHGEHLGANGNITRVDGLGAAHARFGFALDAHRETDARQAFTCRDCHEANSFRFAAGRCEACHREYQTPFVITHVADWGRDCQSCHDGTDRFGRNRFSHDTTEFVLDGAHRTADCLGCHRTTTTLADFAKAPVTCVGCHQADDTHRGGFGTDCVACHTTTTWEGATFRHDEFPLDHGDEGRIACKTCHEDATNYKRYTCTNCHEHSPARIAREHRGEVSGPLENCIRCHQGGRKEGGERRERGER